MKKKSERKLKREEIRKKLEEAIELRAQKLKEYRETPTKVHLNNIIEKLDLSDNSAALLITFDRETLDLSFKGIKCKTSELVTMLNYVFAKVVQDDIGGVMDCVSVLSRQEELIDCWVEHNEQPVEVQDDEDGK